MKKWMLVFLLSAAVLTAKSQAPAKVWTLEECILYARDNNLNLAQSRLNVESAEVDFFQTKTAFAPTVNGSLFGGYTFGQRLDQFNLTFVNQRTTTANLGISGNWLLFGGLQNIHRLKQAKYALDANRMAVLQAENDLSLNLANAYLQVLFGEERVRIADGQLSVTRNQLERTRALYESGAVNRGEFLNIEAQLTREMIAKVNAENALRQSKLSLIQILNLEETDIAVQKINPAIPEEAQRVLERSPFEVYLEAAKLHPGIQGAELSVRSAEKGVAVAKGAFSPSFFFAASYGTGYSSLSQRIIDTLVSVTPAPPTILPTYQGDTVAVPNTPFIDVNFVRQRTPFVNQLKNNQNTQIGFSISIPLFNGLSNHAGLRRTKIQLLGSRLNLDIQKQNLRNLIQTAFNDAMAGSITLEANAKNVEALREAFSYAGERFNAGALNALDYNNAKTQLANAELEELLARFEFLYRIKILEFYMGKPLTL
jgi:outer membrane protein